MHTMAADAAKVAPSATRVAELTTSGALEELELEGSALVTVVTKTALELALVGGAEVTVEVTPTLDTLAAVELVTLTAEVGCAVGDDDTLAAELNGADDELAAMTALDGADDADDDTGADDGDEIARDDDDDAMLAMEDTDEETPTPCPPVEELELVALVAFGAAANGAPHTTLV